MPLRLALNGLFLGHPLTGSGQYTLGLIETLPRIGRVPASPAPTNGAPPTRGPDAARAGPAGSIPRAAAQPAGLDPWLVVNRRVAGLPSGWRVQVAPPRALALAGALGRPGRLANADKLLFEQVDLPRLAARLRADVLLSPYFAAPVRSTVPVVVTVHDLIPLLLPEYRGDWRMQLYLRLVSAGARRARLILADSACTRADVVRVLGIPAERVRVVPLAVDARFRPLPEVVVRAVARRYGLPDRFLLNIGGFDARKNLPRLVEAFAELRRRGYPGGLAIAGRPPSAPSALFPDVAGLVRRLGLEGAVHFPGLVPDADKIALYGACEVMVYPSRYEGFGLPPLEAMACGAPVVAANSSSLPEVVGDAGLTVDPLDVGALAGAIERVVNEPALRADLSRRGLAHAAAFTWEATARQTLAALREVAGR